MVMIYYDITTGILIIIKICVPAVLVANLQMPNERDDEE